MSHEPPARRNGRAIRLYRDPRDQRELLTDTLGVTVDASLSDARGGLDSAPTAAANLLGRRKRERAWEELQDPVSRLMQETTLYPVEPIPSPNDPEFPSYEPKLPDPPSLHDTSAALERLLDALEDALPPRPEPPEPVLRLEAEPPLPSLPDPEFTDR
ncbi:hypothetical protein FJZ36_02310 [Candidatus Poribacteria bacterium]|nr:hypothetical protein [Candidatus Poribacteria bacterium]